MCIEDIVSHRKTGVISGVPENGLFSCILAMCLQLWESRSGSIAIMTALAAPVLMAGLGVAVDYGTLSLKSTQLQQLADSTAVGGAKELALAGSSDQSIKSIVATYIRQDGKSNVISNLVIDRKAGTLNVALEERWTPFFAQFLDASVTPIRVQATATLVGTSSICILTLDGSAPKALHLDKRARISAKDCAVYSNSTHSEGIRLDFDSVTVAELVCSAGGVKAKSSAVTPTPTTDCPPVDDPLASRMAPLVKGCDFTDLKIVAGNRTLDPGTYCGGLEVSGTGIVKFNAGSYVIKDGPFKVSNNARVDGQHVGFYLTGDASVIDFSGNSTITLSGATEKEMAGLLFFEDRSAKLDRKHRIGSANANELTGTIYLSRGSLWVDPNSPVAQNSAYTAIIVHKLELDEGPDLIMNADFGATDVPVPAGIRVSAQVVLTK
jgi:Flp pilus assembly protein TadG